MQFLFKVLLVIVCICATPQSSSAQEDYQPDQNEDLLLTPLKYGWQQGERYAYEVNVETTIDDEQLNSSGFFSLELADENVRKDLNGKPLLKQSEGSSTSTVFAVTADGYLLTCAHCVEGSTEIDVEINGEHYDGTVVDSDDKLDLAIVKIDADALPFVALGDSDQAELAQDVRVIGFPLSGVLGSSVKITKGTIAGFVDADGGNAFQIDAAVNSGNSGGPLADERGNVIAVTNAKLIGETISKVGFAVPIKYAREMLERNEIAFTNGASVEQLSGPQLARKLTPAVGFMTTKLGKNGYSKRTNRLLKFSGYFDHTERVSAMGGHEALRRRMLEAMGRPVEGERTRLRTRKETDSSRVIVDPHGEVIDVDFDVSLPFLMGPMSLLTLEQLPQHSKKKWKQVRLLVIMKDAPSGRRDPFGPMFGPHFGGHHFGPDFVPPGFEDFFPGAPKPDEKKEIELLKLKLTNDYEVLATTERFVTIKRSCHYETVESLDDEIQLDLQFGGELKFDKQQGIFVSGDMSGNLELEIDDEEVSIPLAVRYKQVDSEQPEIATKGPDSIAFPEMESAPDGLTEVQIGSLLKTKLAEVPRSELIGLVDRLSRTEPIQQQTTKVVEMLKAIPVKDDRTLRKSTINALLKWDAGSAVPLMIREFESADRFSRRTWIKRLARTNAPAAADVLVQALTVRKDHSAALSGLRSMGKIAETALLEALGTSGADTASKTVWLKSLGSIGGEQSLKFLESTLSKSKPDWKPEIEAAIDELKQRLQ